MDTSTLKKHKEYTRNEFVDSKYYNQVISILKNAHIKTMIDAGACTGEVTNIMFENIKTLEKSYLIEPMIENIKYIKNNTKGHTVEIINKALLYGEKTISFGKLSHNVGGGSIFLQGDRTIETITLEELPVVDFLKLDVEGAEANIIKNSVNIQKIPFIEIEFHHYDEFLEKEENRAGFIKEWLPNHKIICGGKGSDKEGGLFVILW